MELGFHLNGHIPLIIISKMTAHLLVNLLIT